MALLASESTGKEFPPAPAGTHIARCILLVDMGTQENTMYGKKERKCRIGFELPDEKMVFDEKRGEEPYLVSQNFSLSLGSKANLRKFLKAWRGRDFTAEELKQFDLKTIIDKPALLSVGHQTKQIDGQDRTYAQIVSIGPLMKGQSCPARVLPLTVYEIEQGRDAAFAALPEWMRKQIEKCDEWNAPAPKIESADVPDAPMPSALREEEAMPF
jgi:hypothetical protein